jgi:hypothetical protein
MIAGFVISGTTPKTVVVRALGQSLSAYGIPQPVINPSLLLTKPSGEFVAANDDWQNAPWASDIERYGFPPGNNFEAAIFINLAPGAYTAIVDSGSSAAGTGIVEVYEVDQPATPFGNLSTRARVGTGFDLTIGGFVITGSASQTVVVTGKGPSLAAYGIANTLADPTLTLVRSSDQTVVATNDNWASGSNVAALQASGFAPSNSLESAIYISLAPGAYTAILSGVNGGIGTGIVEVYATQ